jgi:succinoglycan biosynthesis transport protein ExoP
METHTTPSATLGPAALPPGAPKSGGGASIDPLGSLRAHWVMSLVIAMLVIAAGLPVAWWKGTPKYSATAVIFVSPRFIANLEDNKEFDLQSNSQYREYVQQNVRTVNRFDILRDALQKIGPLRSVWVRPDESLDRATERLQGALAVEPVADTYQIAVTLEADKKVGLSELVNAIANIYLERAKAEEFYASDARVRNLIQDRSRLQHEIDRKQARRLELAQELGVSSFTENFLNPYDRLLVTAKEAVSEARKSKIEADAQIGALDDRERPGGLDSLHAYALDQTGRDPSILSMTANLNARRTQLMTTLSGLAPDHPGRRAAERELAGIEKERQEAYQKLVDSYSKMLLDERRADAYKATRVETNLNAEVSRQASQASWFTRGYQEGLQLGLDIERARKRYDSIQQRIDFLSLETKAPGFVRMFSTARPPDLPVKGGRKKIFGMFLAGAFLLALTAPIGVDMLDPRLHSPRAVENILGFPPVAWLMEKHEAGPDFTREQVLRLANRIGQDRQTNDSRIFAFTSVKARGGVSTIVMDTAQALTRLGVPALAVEANAYRADPRYRKPHSRGLTVMLTGHQDLHASVVPADSDLPDRIPVGDLINERNLPDIQNLTDLLRQAAETYRVVLVDIPPILVSVDAEFIARIADVAVLVVEAQSVTKAELQRAAKSLERLNVPAVSVVLNRVRGHASGGFARAALREFETGSAAPRSKWFSPWLWS